MARTPAAPHTARRRLTVCRPESLSFCAERSGVAESPGEFWRVVLAVPGATSVAPTTPSLAIHGEPFGPQEAALLVGCADRLLAFCQIVHAVPGASVLASTTPSLAIHGEPFGPRKAALFVGCADRASPCLARPLNHCRPDGDSQCVGPKVCHSARSEAESQNLLDSRGADAGNSGHKKAGAIGRRLLFGSGLAR